MERVKLVIFFGAYAPALQVEVFYIVLAVRASGRRVERGGK